MIMRVSNMFTNNHDHKNFLWDYNDAFAFLITTRCACTEMENDMWYANCFFLASEPNKLHPIDYNATHANAKPLPEGTNH